MFIPVQYVPVPLDPRCNEFDRMEYQVLDSQPVSEEQDGCFYNEKLSNLTNGIREQPCQTDGFDNKPRIRLTRGWRGRRSAAERGEQRPRAPAVSTAQLFPPVPGASNTCSAWLLPLSCTRNSCCSPFFLTGNTHRHPFLQNGNLIHCFIAYIYGFMHL